MMLLLSVALLFSVVPSQAFVPRTITSYDTTRLYSAPAESEIKAKTKKTNKQTLGLLTFDLDDTLYPIAPVIREANAAFARSMENFGFGEVKPTDIVETGRKIREEIASKDPKRAAVLTHTEIRRMAIRREMETITLERKLKATADDWATPVSDLSPIVINHAKKWASEAVSPSIVEAVLNQWEMERHHAAERHLFPEVIDVLTEIRQEHPNVIIGAVTDGRANPLFMTFTLAKFFDFSMSWEDDQGSRNKFFQELYTASNEAQLKWIYDAALEKYQELAAANAALKKGASNPDPNMVWIHVGDDLAYDVGGSAQSGAKTILVELDEKYAQSARLRFDQLSQPDWSTTSDEELQQRAVMNKKAEDKVDKKIAFLTRLPEAINDILEGI